MIFYANKGRYRSVSTGVSTTKLYGALITAVFEQAALLKYKKTTEDYL